MIPLLKIQLFAGFMTIMVVLVYSKADYYDGKNVPMFQLEPTGYLKKIETPSENVRRVKRAPTHKFKLHSMKQKKPKQQQNTQQNDEIDQTKLSLDILIVTDYSIYQHFLQSTNFDEKDAVNAIYKYYTGVLYELTKMYSAQRLGYMRFKVYPVGIIISKKFKDAPWISAAMGRYGNESMRNVDALRALNEFRLWVKREAENLPQHDHAIAMTRYDLSRFADNNAQGIAYVRSICKVGESVSMVEDVGAMATVAVAGHELAHSLGAEHDGLKKTDGCHKSHNYLMVPAVSTVQDTLPNTFTFSDCTIKQIKKHIFGLNTPGGRRAECLFHSPLENVGYFGLKNTNTNPGQIFNVNKQCQHSFGLTYKFCGDDDYYVKQMCRQIWCRNETIAGRRPPCQSKPYLPALSGTSCGNKMWCINGACVEDEKAPAQEGCPFGDRDTNFCMKLIQKDSGKCKEQLYSRFCCESCRQRKLKIYRKLRI